MSILFLSGSPNKNGNTAALAVAHHLLHSLRRDLFPARDIRRDEGQREQLVIRHGIAVADVYRPLHQLAVDRPALFHDLGGVCRAVFLRQNLLHGMLEHPEVKAVIFYPVLLLSRRRLEMANCIVTNPPLSRCRGRFLPAFSAVESAPSVDKGSGAC